MTVPPGGPDRYGYPAPYHAPGWRAPRPALGVVSLLVCRAAAPEASLVVWAPSPGRPGVTCLDRDQP